MVNFIYSLMTDERKGAVFFPFKFILYMTSLVYGLAIFLRKILYKLHIFNTRKAPLKIISVGNVTLGGTGKTPFTMALAKILEEDLKKNVSVLIRGYGWDEQEMLRRNLADVPILVGEDRFRSSNKAVRLYGSDTAILDDGFQHWELTRDLDIVLIDSRNPFGNGRLFPRGVLREPKRSLGRADVIVLTKSGRTDVGTDGIRKEVSAVNKSAVILEAAHVPKHLYEGRARFLHDLSTVRAKRVILFSSIGDPLYFEETVKGLGANVVEHIKFPDHHDYRKKDIDRVAAICGERRFDLVITTEKDIVKLNRLGLFIGSYKVLTLAVEMQILSGREKLIDRLHSLYTG
ncbi:MAG: tetraacyldisaccharide 4'-kinase [Candidatus Omnitrophota bacterium]|nr:tetraacyldisaccharide 4'-kinase [Candidatus Omnitrophota bacterium]